MLKNTKMIINQREYGQQWKKNGIASIQHSKFAKRVKETVTLFIQSERESKSLFHNSEITGADSFW